MSNELEKSIYYANLFAYYEKLLTNKQQEIFKAYYDDDYSLSEIADSLEVSRNAIWDTLKKVISLLDNYEEKLGLYKKGLALNDALNELKSHTDEAGLHIINEIEKMED